MDFEKIKNEIAQNDGFDTWKLMVECYCTTEPGRRVIDKNVNDLVRRVSADTPHENSGLHKHNVIKSACAKKPILKCVYWYENERGCIDCKKRFKQAVL